MRSFFGAILLGCGILIGGVSGLSALVVMGGSLTGGMSREEMMYLPAILIFAGIPFVIGVGMFFLGRHLIRSADQSDITYLPPEARPGSPPPPPVQGKAGDAHGDGKS